MKTNLPPSALSCIILAAICLAAFWDVQYNDFVRFDDHDYITQNSHVTSGLRVRNVTWAFTSSHSFNWHPITWLSHMLDVELYGVRPAGHHWNNLLLHIGNTLLLFLLLRNLTGAVWRSAVAAALFAVHPLHVESVAWVSERKDVLSALFWMAAMLAYAGYARKREWKGFSLALLFFALGLMSKPVVVTLPFVLLLLDFWPLGRIPSSGSKKEKARVFLLLCREKIPFFILSALVSVVTFAVQAESGAIVTELPLGARIANALVSYARYIFKMFWPMDLSCYYPHPVHQAAWAIIGSVLLLTSISFFAVRTRAKHPYFLVGWLWYLGTLVPMIGLVQVGEQAIADRYTYIPLIGLFLVLCWGIPEIAGRIAPIRPFARALMIALLLFFLLLITRQQVYCWRDTISLFQHEVEVDGEGYRAHFHLAMALEERGRLNEAAAEYSEAIRIRPGFQLGHYHLGNLLAKSGKYSESLKHYSSAIEIDPRDYKSHNNMGFALLKEGKYTEAAHHFSLAVKIHPEDAMAKYNLELALRRAQESGNLSSPCPAGEKCQGKDGEDR